MNKYEKIDISGERDGNNFVRSAKQIKKIKKGSRNVSPEPII